MEVEQGQVPSIIPAAQRAVVEVQDQNDLIVKIGNEFRRDDLIGSLFRHRAAIQGSSGAPQPKPTNQPTNQVGGDKSAARCRQN